jgi:hypothetical protein
MQIRSTSSNQAPQVSAKPDAKQGGVAGELGPSASLARDEFSRTAKAAKPAAEAAGQQSGGLLGFLKKALPFLVPAVGIGMIAKKGIEQTMKEDKKGVLEQLALTAVSPVLGAVNAIKKLF